jgi:thioredoxin 1
MIDQLAQEVAETAKVGKVNVDENPRLAAAYQIEAVPTFLIFRDGQVAASLIGVQSKSRLVNAINLHSGT